MTGEVKQRYQVAIVGGGPVGVALAVDLGQRGISCVVVERHLEPQQVPKGQNLTNRTLEHFYFWNCVDELRAARILPPGYPIGGVTIYGDLTTGYSHSTSITPGRGRGVQDHYFQLNERLPQYLTEEVLRERLKQIDCADTLFGWIVEKVEQDAGGTRMTIAPVHEAAGGFFSWSADMDQRSNLEATAESGSRKVIEADYLVGCDGGRSLVRETLGIQRDGRNFNQRMVLAVFRSNELHKLLTKFQDATTFRVMKPELKGIWQFFGRIDVGEGFFFHGPVPEGTTAENYDFDAMLEQVVGVPFHVEFDHIGFWDLRVMVAKQYGKGRIFYRRRCCAPASTLWRLRPQHWPRGREKFGLENSCQPPGLGWSGASRFL